MNTLPNLPTDNMYKFIGLSGLVLIIFSIYYPIKVADEFSTDIIKLKTALKKVDAKIKIYKDDSTKWSSSINLLNRESQDLLKDTAENGSEYNLRTNYKIIMKKLGDIMLVPSKRDAFDFWIKYFYKLDPFTKINKEIDSLKFKIECDLNQLSIDNIENGGNLELMEHKEKQYDLWRGIYWVGSILGLFLMFSGFYLWYFKVQMNLDKKLSLELKELEKKQPTEQEEPFYHYNE
ncbi:MAG: hypothetical protein ABR968_15250 [Bacteroidales bacterium]|jgi:hypothetical protein